MPHAPADISNKEAQDRLQRLAREVISEISELDPSYGKEFCGISRAMFRREANRLKKENSCSV